MPSSDGNLPSDSPKPTRDTGKPTDRRLTDKRGSSSCKSGLQPSLWEKKQEKERGASGGREVRLASQLDSHFTAVGDITEAEGKKAVPLTPRQRVLQYRWLLRSAALLHRPGSCCPRALCVRPVWSSPLSSSSPSRRAAYPNFGNPIQEGPRQEGFCDGRRRKQRQPESPQAEGDRCKRQL